MGGGGAGEREASAFSVALIRHRWPPGGEERRSGSVEAAGRGRAFVAR